MRRVYFFAPDDADQSPARDLGEEGRGLLTMGRLGLPVLPGFLVFPGKVPRGAGAGSPPEAIARQVARCLRRLWALPEAAEATAGGGSLRLELRAAGRRRQLRVPAGAAAGRGAAKPPAASSRTAARVLAAARSLVAGRSGRADAAPGPAGPALPEGPVIVQLSFLDDRECPRRTCYSRDPGTGGPGLCLVERGVGQVGRPPGRAQAGQLSEACAALERELQQVQEVQFALAGGRLRLVSTRSAVCSPAAALRVAVDWAVEGRISREEALRRVSPAQIDVLLRPQRTGGRTRGSTASRGPLEAVRGRGVCPGVGAGELALSLEQAEAAVRTGRRVILAWHEDPPAGADWLARCQGFVLGGGADCPLAAAARRWGIPAVAAGLRPDGARVRLGSRLLQPGEWLSVDGSRGEILFGPVRLSPGRLSRRAVLLLSWADAVRRRPPSGAAGVEVRANADLPEEALLARRFGADGLGLVRTERMLLGPAPLRLFRTAILMDGPWERELSDRALQRLEWLQRREFRALLRVMAGFPVIVRLLDPPLHEFLPEDPAETRGLAEELGLSAAEVLRRIESVRQRNPMLGLRGCRLGLLRPGIYAMQARALAEAAIGLRQAGVDVQAQIMIPLVSSLRELSEVAAGVRRVLAEVSARFAADLRLPVGTMIETPRAALGASRLARVAEFFSFGTNDLTQLCFGYSRDDAGQFLPVYLEKGILPADPFRVLDEEGVGELVRIAVRRGRRERPDLQCGLCGEQAAEAPTVDFCTTEGIEYVSCAPYRIPAARLAAAQAVLRRRVNFRFVFPS